MASVHVVPHTHWDREWYKPFPVFRMQLVELLDALLDTLETDETYRHFQLDGQMAVIDDYLAMRPDARDRLADLNRRGRLSMGPWYTLPDEFLVSGETHVRNLQLGMRRAADFGGAMAVGYLPDMFGHIAQMPQILTQFGFDDAVVWRGGPSSVTATVCSQCAAREPSLVTTVHSSSSTRVLTVPSVSIGSIASTEPGANSGPRPGTPSLGRNGSMCICRPMPCPP